MQITKRCRYLAILIAIAASLTACGDKEQEKTSTNTATEQTGSGKVQTGNVCDTYIAQMKACIDSKASEQDKAQLNTSLDYLKKQMALLNDQEQITQLCQKNLDNIQEQKKALGCN